METPAPATPRRGWFWTILKCLILMVVLAAAGALALHLLLGKVVPPWFVPKAVFEWLMEHVRPYALALGAAVGGFVGFLGSVGVVIWDARKGRLTRVR